MTYQTQQPTSSFLIGLIGAIGKGLGEGLELVASLGLSEIIPETIEYADRCAIEAHNNPNQTRTPPAYDDLI